MTAFPLFVASDGRRLFQSESYLRRMAQTGAWSERSRLLELHGSLGGLALVRALECHLVQVEPEPTSLQWLKDRARAANIDMARLDLREGSTQELNGLSGPFDGVFCLGRVLGHLDEEAARLRPLLSPRARLAITTVIKAGLKPSPHSLETWERRLGRPLVSPRDALLQVEAAGFEPETIDTLSDAELDVWYRELEATLARTSTVSAEVAAAVRAEIAAHKAAGGNSGVTYAMVIARRKEPGEKPPLARGGV